jgi:hypothetical protein
MTMVHIPRYGCIPDLARQGPKFAAARQTLTDSFLPDEANLSSAAPPRLNQLSEGSCCLHSVTTELRYNWINNGQPDVPLSINQLYFDVRRREGTINSDVGCQIANAVDVARTIGVCRNELWPYDVSKWADAPPDSVYADAIKHHGMEPWGVEVDPLAIRAALWEGKPVIIGFSVYPSFEDDDVTQTGYVKMPGSAERVMSGHSMWLFARKPGFFGLRNWWGLDWGTGIADPNIRGDCWMPEAYFTPEYANDLWVIAMTEGDQ